MLPPWSISQPSPVDARSKAFCGRSPPGIAGSNSAECCVLSGRGVCVGRSAVQRSPTVCVCVCVCVCACMRACTCHWVCSGTPTMSMYKRGQKLKKRKFLTHLTVFLRWHIDSNSVWNVRLDSLRRQKFFFSQIIRTGLGPTQPPAQWMLGLLPRA